MAADGTFLVSFRGPAHETYARIPPRDVLSWHTERDEDGALPEEARKKLAGRIVVVGVNLAGAQDIVSAPISGTMHGPEYQATILDNMLHGDGRIQVGRGVDTTILFVLAVLLGAASAATRGRWLPHLVAVLFGLLVLVGAFALFAAGTSIDLFTPLLAVILVWGGTTLLRLLTEGRRNRWLQGTFGRYMAPSIIEALKKDPALLAARRARAGHITVLFSDVAGFTKHVGRSWTATDVVDLLNRYLTVTLRRGSSRRAASSTSSRATR